MVWLSKQARRTKEKTIVESTSSKKESDSNSDDDIALFIKRFKKVMKRDGYFNNKRRSRSQGGPTSHALGVGKLVISLPIAPTQRTRTRVRTRSIAKAKRGTRVKLILVWNRTLV
jgi:hypothetical protein